MTSKPSRYWLAVVSVSPRPANIHHRYYCQYDARVGTMLAQLSPSRSSVNLGQCYL